MARALLVVPPFWDPVCVPLGISSLKAYAEQLGHIVCLLDFNVEPKVFNLQRRYFTLGKRLFPWWNEWNIERNGTSVLAMHQLLYLEARHSPRYREMVVEILDLDLAHAAQIEERLAIAEFDEIFGELHSRLDGLLRESFERLAPDVVGCSLYNSTWPATLLILRCAKLALPGVRTAVGGPGPTMGITADMREVSSFMDRHDCIDYFVLGEGEKGFGKILEDPLLPRGILGAESGPTRLRRQGGTREALVLSELPYPDYGELPTNQYLNLSMAASRGCPFECSFCAETVFWSGYRRLSSDGPLQQMCHLAERYQRNSFYLCDSLANPVIDSLTDGIVRSGADFRIDCYLRPDRTCSSPDETLRWRQGGLYRARLGMESASQRILDLMVKKTTPGTMSRSLGALAGAGVLTSTLWIVGYLEETEAEFQATIDFVRDHRELIAHADAWVFQYHASGLAGAAKPDSWSRPRARYSSDITEIAGIQLCLPEDQVSSEERFARLARFVRRMEELDIPNPYSLYEWSRADQRWRELGRNAGWDVSRTVFAMNA